MVYMPSMHHQRLPSTALASAVMCLDGVPFKIGESFKCPALKDVFGDETANVNVELLSNEYTFTTENAVLKWMEDLKTETQRKKLAVDAAKNDTLSSGSTCETKPKTASNKNSGKTGDVKCVNKNPGRSVEDKSANNVSQPANFGVNLLTPITVAPNADNEDASAGDAGIVDKLDISLFEKVDDPFEDLELQTINDMEELKDVLQATSSLSSSPSSKDTLVKGSDAGAVNANIVNAKNHKPQPKPRVVPSVVDNTSANNTCTGIKGDNCEIAVCVTAIPAGNSTSGVDVTASSAASEANDVNSNNNSRVAVGAGSVELVNQSLRSAPLPPIPRRVVRRADSGDHVYDNAVTGDDVASTTSEDDHKSTIKALASLGQPDGPTRRRKSDAEFIPKRSERSNSDVTDVVTPPTIPVKPPQTAPKPVVPEGQHPQLPVKPKPLAARDSEQPPVPARTTTEKAVSCEAAQSQPSVPSKTNPKPLTQQRLDAIAAYIGVRKPTPATPKPAPKPAPRVKKKKQRNSSSSSLEDLKSFFDDDYTSGSDIPNNDGNSSPDENAPPVTTTKNVSESDAPNIPPRSTSLLVDSNNVAISRLPPPPPPPPRPLRSPIVTAVSSTSNSSSSSWHHFNTLPTPATPKINDDPYNRMSEEAKKFIDDLSSMGFPRARVARAVERFGQDDKVVVEHLCLVNRLSDLGYKCGQSEVALQLYSNNYEQACKYLELFQQFQELGFTSDKIRTAIYNNNINRDKALDELTMLT